jgi:hypothetical protein
MLELPYLPPNRRILYVSLENQFMQAAKDTAENFSLDPSHPTGAVMVPMARLGMKKTDALGNRKIYQLVKGMICVKAAIPKIMRSKKLLSMRAKNFQQILINQIYTFGGIGGAVRVVGKK